jgi:hypothetical protein
MSNQISILSSRYWVLLVYLGLSIVAYFTIGCVTTFQVQQLQTDSAFITILATVGIGWQWTVCSIGVLSLGSFLGYYYAKRKNNVELRKGFMITSIISITLIAMSIVLMINS